LFSKCKNKTAIIQVMVKFNHPFRNLPFQMKSKTTIIRSSAVVIAIAVIGTVLLISSHAQSPFASVDASSGTLSTPASKVADSNTDSGYKVVFGSSGSGTQTTNCFASPVSCGYPDIAGGNVGVTPSQCASLPTFSPAAVLGPASNDAGGSSNSVWYDNGSNIINLDGSNFTIKGYNIPSYAFDLTQGTNVTFDDDCIYPPGSLTNSSDQSDIHDGGGSHTTIENSTIYNGSCPAASSATTNCKATPDLSSDIGGGTAMVVKNNILLGAVEAVNSPGPGSIIEDNYIVTNGSGESDPHSEDLFLESDDSNLTIDHNTLLNPFYESEVIFFESDSSQCGDSNITVNNNLMAGAGYVIDECADSTSITSNAFTITNNDIARCNGGIGSYDSSDGGTLCPGGSSSITTTGGFSVGAGADSHGYFPKGGYYGVAAFGEGSSGVNHAPAICANTVWSGNHWDDTGATISCD
jgi:hypothetical protein